MIRPCPPVAQWIRATDFGSVGRGFESLRAGQWHRPGAALGTSVRRGEGRLILRVVSGRIRPGQLHAVTESFRAAYSPVAARTPGLNRFVVATRPDDDGGHHLAAMTIWDSVELALAAYGGDLTRPRTLDGRDHGAALDRVDYYELGAWAF